MTANKRHVALSGLQRSEVKRLSDAVALNWKFSVLFRGYNVVVLERGPDENGQDGFWIEDYPS